MDERGDEFCFRAVVVVVVVVIVLAYEYSRSAIFARSVVVVAYSRLCGIWEKPVKVR